MPALSSNIENYQNLFPDRATVVVFCIALVSISAILIRRKLLFGSFTISASQFNASEMSTGESSEQEKTKLQYEDLSSSSQQPQTPDLPHLNPSGHSRSLSSQLPPPTLKPYLAPLSSASNAAYFSNSPITETPSTVESPFTTFSPNTNYSQSTSFSEPPSINPERDGPTRRRSYTKTLSLPLPNSAAPNAIPMSHPSAQTIFPLPTSRPFVEDGARGMAGTDIPIPSPGMMVYSDPEMMGYPGETILEVEVQGEIIVAEGWRRHTRVFGGGVCKACEESKERQQFQRRGMA